LELPQVRYFLALAQTLNFTRAAEQCNITQSALTRSVQKLESELGGPLIHRERKLTQLTDLAKIVLPMLERLVQSAEMVRSRAVEFRATEIAPLRIGLAPCVSAAVLVETLRDLTRIARGVQIDLIEGDRHILLENLLNGGIHAAITPQPEPLPDRIRHWPLFEERAVALMARDHPLARKTVLTMREVREADWLGRDGCDMLERLVEACFDPDMPAKVTHRGRLESHLQWMAAAGLGLLLAPEHAPWLPALVARPIAGDPVRRSVELLVVGGRRYSPALSGFINAIRVQDWAMTRDLQASVRSAG
jgi:DNA-binding transcriptional LysR family regulator